MKKAVLLAPSLLLAANMAIAQDALGSSSAVSQDQSQNATTSSSSLQTGTLRGCLSGSRDNYTLTDRNGTQYRLLGQDDALATALGHEVEISGMQSQSTETGSSEGEMSILSANTLQVSQVQDTGSRCNPRPPKMGDHSMDGQPPKGAPGAPAS